jgi:hypothetical protein
MISFSEGDQSGERDLRSGHSSGEDRNLDARVVIRASP